MSSINFDNPWLLFVALPLVVLTAVPFALAIRKDNINGHNVASGIIHVLMAVLIAFAAAGASVITTVTQTDVYVLADVSYSASLNLDAVDGYIDDLSGNLPANSRMGVICFAKGHKLITRLGEKFTTVKDSGVDDSSTNITDALSYAGSLFRDDVIKRIVLITDGKATDGSSDDALKRQINSLAERKIHVDAIFMDNNMKGDVTEVQMSGADFSSSVSLGREEQVKLTVRANCPENGSLSPVITLYKDGELYKTATPAMIKGENTVSFPLDTAVAGAHDYRAVIECDGDFNGKNNEISFTQSVSGKTDILLISNNYADDTAIKKLYADKIAAGSASVTSYINRTDIPITVEELCRYDEIIISDYDVSKAEASETFLKNLDTVVSLYGKSLLTFGDTHIQGNADGGLSALSDMLPVMFGKSEQAPKIYTLLIDTSRSMETLLKLDRAKKAAKQIVNMLSSEDMISVVEFNGDAFIPQSPILVSAGRESVLAKIDALEVRQGTEMGSGFDYARRIMEQGVYSEKRLVLISDGLDHGTTDVCAKVRQLRALNIYTSVLDVGRGMDKGQAATAAANLLKDIAAFGNTDGVPLDISTETNLDSVIENELSEGVTDYTGGSSWISVNRRKDDALNGLSEDDVKNNYVKGYIKSAAKPNAATVLNVSYWATMPEASAEDERMEIKAPLYAYWKYGNGKAASFTSSLTGNWTSSMDGEIKDKLFTNVLDTAVPDEKVDYPFQFVLERSSATAKVTVSPANVRNDAWAKYSVTDPDGNVTEGEMSFGGLSYGYSFVTPSEGKYTVTVTYGYGDYTKTATKYLNVDYSPEYDSFALYDASALIRGVGANGKVSTDGKLKIENDDKEVGRYNLSLAMPLLIACVVLYAVDIAVRKLKWEDIKSLFGRGKK